VSIYAESSAVAAWLLGEGASADVRRILAEAARLNSVSPAYA
jgi:hypothetical protein